MKNVITNKRYSGVGLLVGALVAMLPLVLHANPLDDYTRVQQQLTQQAAQVKTLSDELRVLDQTIAAKSDYLKGIQSEAATVRTRLAEINGELTGLEEDRQYAREALAQLVRRDYVEGHANAYFVIASAGSLSQLTQTSSYVGIIQEKTNGVVNHLNQLERRENEQRQTVMDQVHRLDTLEQQANQEAAELAAVRDAKQTLLSSTQGQEDVYRQQFEAARDELVKMGVFGKSGCSRVGSRVWPGDGNYFNQCDPRWADVHLGFSDNSTIGDYGCGITSLAMLYEYYGFATDPLQLNDALKQTGGFVDDLMQWRGAAGPSGGRLALANNPYGGVDWGAINAQLDSGNPVIVYINRAVTNHYVMLLSRDGSTYRMNDPIEGPGLRFSDYYSTDAVQQFITFRRN